MFITILRQTSVYTVRIFRFSFVQQNSPKFTGYSTKFPRASQPNLDYVAPEAQLYNSMSPLADMFSLGMVLCAIHNDGRSLIEADNNPNVYIKKLPEIPTKFLKIADKLPKSLVEPIRKTISQDVRDRPTSQLFALVRICGSVMQSD
ncbi:hypothetical protein P879_02877 [Paragonimus westermani]|uniref:Protein kinase domain-containing protein n=1 Tax=Paragonimus westermani TaxID=34504 RepID=A0A8T0DXX4_9TREM|nr:hypothetical protein P879_02877 [Paragonimus westermani]